VKDSADEVIKRRYSCRSYVGRAIETSTRDALSDVLISLKNGPFGSRTRFSLIAATEDDWESLKGLGTYGFVRGAPGFIVGAVGEGAKNLEDYGFCLERAVLEATDLGLQTCWLGGTFTKTSFAHRIGVAQDEIVPAVAAVGYATEGSRNGRMRRFAGSDGRLPPEQLFFDGRFGRPLAKAAAGEVIDVLEAVRWAPSASNKQPWRVVRSNIGGGEIWHFFLERAKRLTGSRSRFSLLRMADLPRVDMGIAMCHFTLAAAERGLQGRWVLQNPAPHDIAGPGWEYTASWIQMSEP